MRLCGSLSEHHSILTHVTVGPNVKEKLIKQHHYIQRALNLPHLPSTPLFTGTRQCPIPRVEAYTPTKPSRPSDPKKKETSLRRFFRAYRPSEKIYVELMFIGKGTKIKRERKTKNWSVGGAERYEELEAQLPVSASKLESNLAVEYRTGEGDGAQRSDDDSASKRAEENDSVATPARGIPKYKRAATSGDQGGKDRISLMRLLPPPPPQPAPPIFDKYTSGTPVVLFSPPANFSTHEKTIIVCCVRRGKEGRRKQRYEGYLSLSRR